MELLKDRVIHLRRLDRLKKQKLAKEASPHESLLSAAIALMRDAQAGSFRAEPSVLQSMIPAIRRAARNRLLRLSQVLALMPCAAGRMLAIMARRTGASAFTVPGNTPAISAIRLMADFMSRSWKDGRSAPSTRSSTSPSVFILFSVSAMVFLLLLACEGDI
jgi:hypothetical protein